MSLFLNKKKQKLITVIGLKCDFVKNAPIRPIKMIFQLLSKTPLLKPEWSDDYLIPGKTLFGFVHHYFEESSDHFSIHFQIPLIFLG